MARRATRGADAAARPGARWERADGWTARGRPPRRSRPGCPRRGRAVTSSAGGSGLGARRRRRAGLVRLPEESAALAGQAELGQDEVVEATDVPLDRDVHPAGPEGARADALLHPLAHLPVLTVHPVEELHGIGGVEARAGG